MTKKDAADYLSACADGYDPVFDEAVEMAITALRTQVDTEPGSMCKDCTHMDDLLDIIAELKTDVVREAIPHEHCPYAYCYYPEWKPVECDDCTTCKMEFFEHYKKQARKEAEKLKEHF